MIYHFRTAFFICLIVFAIVFLIKRKPLLWIASLSLALLPYITLLSGAIYSVFNGSGLVGDSGGIESGGFVIVIYLWYFWYIYIPALLLIVVSFYKVFIEKGDTQ